MAKRIREPLKTVSMSQCNRWGKYVITYSAKDEGPRTTSNENPDYVWQQLSYYNPFISPPPDLTFYQVKKTKQKHANNIIDITTIANISPANNLMGGYIAPCYDGMQ